MKIEIKVEDIEKKKVKRSGNSGRIYVPQEWVGKEIFAILPADEFDIEEMEGK